MIAALTALVAFAEPPRGEVIVGFNGNSDQGFGFVSVQPALARSEDASFLLRGTVSQLYYTFPDLLGLTRVEAPGMSLGPAFLYTPRDFIFSLNIGLGARHATRTVGDFSEARLVPDATLGGDIQWRPDQRASIYGLFSFMAAEPYLWARAGAMHPVYPFIPRDEAASVWLGVETTSSGNFRSRLLEVGPVMEVPVRDLRAAFSVRGGLAIRHTGDLFIRQGFTLGAGLYWSY